MKLLRANDDFTAPKQDPFYTVSSVTRSSTEVTVTFSEAHGLSVGDRIYIEGANERGYNSSDIGGIPHKITAVPSTTTIKYVIATEPDSPATGTITAKAGNITIPDQDPILLKSPGVSPRLATSLSCGNASLTQFLKTTSGTTAERLVATSVPNSKTTARYATLWGYKAFSSGVPTNNTNTVYIGYGGTYHPIVLTAGGEKTIQLPEGVTDFHDWHIITPSGSGDGVFVVASK